MKKFVIAVAFVLATTTMARAQSIQEVLGETAQSQIGIVLTGGNPVPGASSTLGIRLGTIPRISVAVRATGANLTIPNFETIAADDEVSSFVRSTNVDAALGIFSGVSVAPTIGGFGSIDVLASYGKIGLPEDDGFAGAPTSWGAGLRLGILRESFTAPGIAVSAMYRRVGDYTHTMTNPFTTEVTTTQVDKSNVLSLRGTVGKRILMLGAVAGVGYDRYSADAEIRGATTSQAKFESNTTTIFANLSWTMLLLHIVGEGGIQRGDDDSNAYGSLAVRLAL